MSPIHKHCSCVSACSLLVKHAISERCICMHATYRQQLYCDVQEAQIQLAMMLTTVVANHSKTLLAIAFVHSYKLMEESQNKCKLLHHCLIVMLLQLKDRHTVAWRLAAHPAQ